VSLPATNTSPSIADVYSEITKTRPNIVYTSSLSASPSAGAAELPREAALASLSIGHGDMIYAFVDAESSAIGGSGGDNAADGNGNRTSAGATAGAGKVGKMIGKDGSIQSQTFESASNSNSFRPGMRALRDMKMQWTLAEFMEMDSQFQYKLKRQDEAICKGVSIDMESCNSFQSYLRNFAFKQSRFGILFGTYDKVRYAAF
jgi:nuclear protein localization family protein 4